MTLQPTVWQQNAASFATTTTEWGDQERRLGLVNAMDDIRDGDPGHAFFVLMQSIRRQWLAAGLGNHVVATDMGPDDGVRHVVVVPRFDRRTGGAR